MDRTYVLSKSADNLFGLPRNMLTSSLQMICERGFPLLSKYSLVISRMLDAGIIEKLYADFRYNATYLEQIRTYSQKAEETVIVLRLRHMDGAFAVLLVGSSVAVICFFIEIVVDTHKRQQRARRRWKRIRDALPTMVLGAKKNEQKQNEKFSVRYVPEMLREGLNTNTDGQTRKVRTSKHEFRYLE